MSLNSQASTAKSDDFGAPRAQTDTGYETPVWVRLDDGSWRRYGAVVKVPFPQRLFEFLFASAMLLITAPLMLVIAILIKMDSPGPVLFRANRVGVNGEPFPFYKFRTQYIDSKERFPELCSYEFDENEVGSVHLQIEDDPRVTRIGAFLRRTSLDEIPNLWSVLTGSMALVGPRPELWDMAKYYQRETLDKFSVRPGITGLAQVCGRGYLTFSETNALDLEYVRGRSWLLDLKILLKTVRQTLTGHGAM